ncbi:BACON domain-containing protein, partial [Streptomyces beihaiensis]|nr:hypothetical protein [Streptomyces beihaiensis]
ALPLAEAPRAALRHAMRVARPASPRFDRCGFPMDPKDHVARRDRLRARAVTTTVVATVVAAPVLALWAAYRGAPLTGEGTDGRSVTASEAGGQGALDGKRPGDRYENAGNASTTPDPRFTVGGRSPDVSVEVVSPPTRAGKGPGRLTVEAQPSGGVTLITLTASGDSPVHWSARTAAPWLHLSRTSGTVRPGDSSTVRVYVDHDREPAGHWSARVAIDPSGAVITLEGYGGSPAGNPGPPAPTSRPDPSPSDPGSPDPTPSGGPSASQDPTPPPSGSGSPSPDPTPTPSSSGSPSTSPGPSGSGSSTPAS